eukprot:CAMPEP_0181376154 /NCGR_PEP_ID=MMETSP1106-20121128/17137_1 /TAXON_ID=81844 /ORGANISM="Mantoniella antarctica, Strain SL-175" /LENGTH=169 /DNA_ID=CAMNT_0023494653 /DNA_START=24 /DNA_END=530 /DNA_ORIENTATION=+
MGASPDECDSAEAKAGIADGRNAAGAATVGAQYTRHSDAAHGKNAERVLTCILYLNEGWDQARDGGCLRVWPQSKANADAHAQVLERRRRLICATSAQPRQQDEQQEHEAGERGRQLIDPLAEALEPAVDVAPVGNRLVVFWSDTRCPHAVQPVNPRVAVGAGRYAVSF